MSGLTLSIETSQGSGVWQDLLARFTNTNGTPIVSADANNVGAIAGVYLLTFSSVVAADHATVKVQAASPDNPYNDQIGKLVDLDGATVYRNIIGGVDLVFSNAGGFTSAWTATVRVGFDFGPQAGFGAGAGQPSTARRIRVTNGDSDAAQNVTGSIVRHAKLFPTAGQIFERVFDFAAGATESLTGQEVQPYAITVENVTGSGGSKTMDVKVGGALVNVENVTTPGSGTSAGLNVTDTYRITSGALTDVEFQLSENATNADTANILIFNARFTQIAPDTGGAPGDWGTVDVFVTQEGQADGVILAGEVGYFWARALVPDGSISESNPAILDVQISAQMSSAAAWAA